MENPELLRKTYRTLRDKKYTLSQIAIVRRLTRVEAMHEMRMLNVWEMSLEFAVGYKLMDEKLDRMIGEGVNIVGMAERLEKENRARGGEAKIGEKEVYRLLSQHCKLKEYRKKHGAGSRIDEEEEKRRKNILEEIAKSGKMLCSVTGKLGVNEERVRQLMRKYEIYEIWKKNLKGNRQRKEKDEKLIKCIGIAAKAVLLGCCLGMAENRWQEDAARYCVKRNCLHEDEKLEKIMKLLKAYDGCIEGGVKMTFEELGEEAGINAGSARDILLKTGRESLNYTIKPHKKRRINIANLSSLAQQTK